jgi:hypothetical protein
VVNVQSSGQPIYISMPCQFYFILSFLFLIRCCQSFGNLFGKSGDHFDLNLIRAD